MKYKYKYLVLISILIFPLAVFAQGQLYSEYYPNPHAKFKGTIIFENGSGAALTEWTENEAFFQCAKQYGNLFLYDRIGSIGLPVTGFINGTRGSA